jgi:hypothetical protein
MKTNVNEYEDQTLHQFVVSYADPNSDKLATFEIIWPYDEEFVWDRAKLRADKLIIGFDNMLPIYNGYAWDIVEIKFRASKDEDLQLMWKAD